MKDFFENGNISQVYYYDKDDTVSKAGYDFKEGSYLRYKENGDLLEYFFDENYNIKNEYFNGKLYEHIVVMDGVKTVTQYNIYNDEVKDVYTYELTGEEPEEEQNER
ncbi:MAG: hypothetical protein IKE01_04690 [Clostridia bacterium]|nr:hypothetical protein [Clostridia bacterium]